MQALIIKNMQLKTKSEVYESGRGQQHFNLMMNLPQSERQPSPRFTSRTVRQFNNTNYCWSHGFDVALGHTSATCRFKKPGHKEAMMRGNRMGGSEANRCLVMWQLLAGLVLGLTSKNKVNQTQKLIVADSGASGHFVCPDFCFSSFKESRLCINVSLLDGSTLESRKEGSLNIPSCQIWPIEFTFSPYHKKSDFPRCIVQGWLSSGDGQREHPGDKNWQWNLKGL